MPSKSRHDPLEEAYREETARLVRARFPYAVGYYLVASAALLFLEWQHHPERAMWLTWRDLLDVGLCVLGFLALRTQSRPPWPSAIAAGLVTWIVLANATYVGSLGGQMERFVMVQVALLNLVVVPALYERWGGRTS